MRQQTRKINRINNELTALIQRVSLKIFFDEKAFKYTDESEVLIEQANRQWISKAKRKKYKDEIVFAFHQYFKIQLVQLILYYQFGAGTNINVIKEHLGNRNKTALDVAVDVIMSDLYKVV